MIREKGEYLAWMDVPVWMVNQVLLDHLVWGYFLLPFTQTLNTSYFLASPENGCMPLMHCVGFSLCYRVMPGNRGIPEETWVQFLLFAGLKYTICTYFLLVLSNYIEVHADILTDFQSAHICPSIAMTRAPLACGLQRALWRCQPSLLWPVA